MMEISEYDHLRSCFARKGGLALTPKDDQKCGWITTTGFALTPKDSLLCTQRRTYFDRLETITDYNRHTLAA